MTGERLTSPMMSALGAMPVTLLNGCLPPGAPPGGTIRALQARGLIELADGGRQWRRTLLGAAAWEHR